MEVVISCYYCVLDILLPHVLHVSSMHQFLSQNISHTIPFFSGLSFHTLKTRSFIVREKPNKLAFSEILEPTLLAPEIRHVQSRFSLNEQANYYFWQGETSSSNPIYYVSMHDTTVDLHENRLWCYARPKRSLNKLCSLHFGYTVYNTFT